MWFSTAHQSKHSTGRPFGKTRPCSVWRIEAFGTARWILAWQYTCHVMSHFVYVVFVMKPLLPYCSAVWVPGPEAKTLVGSRKSRLGLAHCWGWLRFAAEPQPNSPSTVRRRSVYSPEPWPTSGFTVRLRARDIIPAPHLPSFSSCRFFFCALILNLGALHTCVQCVL